MKIRNMLMKYYSPAEGDGGDGSGAPAAGTGGDGSGAPAAGTGGTDWTASLPDNYKTHLTKNGIKDINGLIENHINMQGYVGSSIRIPSEDASAEAKQEFISKLMKHAPDLIPRPKAGEDNSSVFAALGRPDDIKGYGDVQVPESIAEAVPQERLEALRELAHKNNLTKDQFNGVVSEVLAIDAAAHEARLATLKEGQDALHREWGAAYPERSSKAVSLLESTGAPQPILDAFKNGMATAEAIKWVYELSSRMGGEGAGAHMDSGARGILTPDEAKMQLSDIMNNTTHPYWNPSSPDHKDAIDRVIKLGRLAEPQTANMKIRGSMSFDT